MRPSTTPYSSTTSAEWVLRRRNACNCSRSVVASGMNHASSAMSAALQLARVAAGGGEGAEQILGVQHADDVVGFAAPQRHARIGRGQHFAHQFVGRQIGVDRAHFGAMDHRVADRDLVEFEQAAEHVALVARDLALAMQDVDGALQFLGAGDAELASRPAKRRTACSKPRTSTSTALTTGPNMVTKNATTRAIHSESLSG